jgi:hypothetical protein
MRKRSVPILLVASVFMAMIATPGSARAPRGATVRPDIWIKLCGLSTGCTIDPLPHPWLGDDVYNASGWHQRIAVRMEDGEDVRFWLTLQNDAELEDTLVIQGCRGTRQFRIIAVKIGFLKRPNWRPRDITQGFKNGTATFTLPPASEGKRVPLTLAMIAPTTAEGVTYRCPITIRSQTDPSVSDTVVAIMTTY